MKGRNNCNELLNSIEIHENFVVKPLFPLISAISKCSIFNVVYHFIPTGGFSDNTANAVIIVKIY